MPTHEMLSQFDKEQYKWPSYMERLDHYLWPIMDVEESGKKRSILLTTCGSKMYKLERSLAIPRTLAEFSNYCAAGPHPFQSETVRHYIALHI